MQFDRCGLCRDSFNRKPADIGAGAGMFECDGAHVTLSIDIQHGVFIEILALFNIACSKFDVESVRVVEVFDFRDLTRRKQKYRLIIVSQRIPQTIK